MVGESGPKLVSVLRDSQGIISDNVSTVRLYFPTAVTSARRYTGPCAIHNNQVPVDRASERAYPFLRNPGLRWGANKPLPGPSGDESPGKFDGGDYRLDVEVSGQGISSDPDWT